MSRTLFVALAAAMLGAALGAQAPAASPVFDVTSVKVNRDGALSNGVLSPGLFEQTNVTLNQLVRMAYGHDATGGPNWVGVEHFDVAGKGSFDLSAYLPSADGSAPRVYLMLRALLADRFKLATHLTTVERPVYALTLARDDGRFGPGLHRSDVNCAAVLAAQVRHENPELPASARRPPCGLQLGHGRIHGNAITMAQLANALNGIADRPVVDQTGLAGYYDVDIDWLGAPQAGSSDRPPAPSTLRNIDDEPIFSELRSQLGLKLEPTRAGIDRVVIDHAEQPTAD